MKTKLLYSLFAFIVSLTIYAQEQPVPQTQLPAQAKTFLKDHFKSKFHHAMKDVERNNIHFEVTLEDGTEIEFAESGKWREVDGKGNTIPYTFIQKQILDYIKIHHPKDSIYIFEQRDYEYEAKLSSGLELIFDAMGVFRRLD